MDEQWGVGDQAKSKAFATTMVGNKEVELIHGQFPHSRSDNSFYARFEGGRIEEFDGHRLLHEITFKDYNYMKESELSGDQIRKGGTCIIKINGRVCWQFFYREVEWAMREAQHMLGKIHEHPIHLWDEKAVAALPGRKIYWRDEPAVIERYIDDQACVIIVPKNGLFKMSASEIEDGERDHDSVKADVFDPHIWWYRNK